MNTPLSGVTVMESWPNEARSQGDLPNPEDIYFRNRYNLSDNSPPDGVLSAQELVWNNPGQGSSWHYDDFPIVPFVAQTTIAASYGLLQIWWATAQSEMNWNRGDAGSPSVLIDPTLNLDLGVGYLHKKDRAALQADPTMSWDLRWRTALANYNHSTPFGTYANDVMSRAPHYAPIAR
ncbi:MAG TPA: hypothetical protein VNN55_10705 [bacterium]|nr:hypothetical protein [bacterium]